MEDRRRRSFVLSTSAQRTIRFLVGLGLVIYEAVIRVGETRWPFLVFYAGMMGMPLAERADDLRRAASGRARHPSGSSNPTAEECS